MKRTQPSIQRLVPAALLSLAGFAAAQPSSPAPTQPAAPSARDRFFSTVAAASPQPEQMSSTWVAALPSGNGYVSLGIHNNSVALLLNGKPFPADCVESSENAVVYSWPKGNPVAALRFSGGSATPVLMGQPSALAPVDDPDAERLVLGIGISTLSDEVAEHLRIKPDEVIYVSGITPGFGAEAAGLKARDIITAIDGNSPITVESLRAHLATKSPGDKVRVTVLRAGETLDLAIKLKSWRASDEAGADAPAVPALADLPLAGFFSNEGNADRQRLALDRARLAELYALTSSLQRRVGIDATQDQVEVTRAQARELQSRIASQEANAAAQEAITATLASEMTTRQSAQHVSDLVSRLVVTPEVARLPYARLQSVVPDEQIAAAAQLELARGAYERALAAVEQKLENVKPQITASTDATEHLARQLEELSARMERLEAMLAKLAEKLAR